MDKSWILLFNVLFEALFFLTGYFLSSGVLLLGREKAETDYGPFALPSLLAAAASVIVQACFFIFGSSPHRYLFSMFSGFLMTGAYVMMTESAFGSRGKDVWLNFKKYKAGTVEITSVQKGFGNTRRIALRPAAAARELVLYVRADKWEKVRKLFSERREKSG